MKRLFTTRKKNSNGIDEVYKKIQQNTKNVKGLKEEDLKRYAKNLGEEKALKQAYLNLQFDAIKKMYEKMEEEEKETKETKLLPNLKSAGKITVSKDTISKDEITSDVVDFNTMEHREKLAREKFGEKGCVKIKLIIAEIAKTSNERAFRKLLSPIATNLHLMGDYGWFHSALIIGPWYIEWNSSSLCIPRKCYSSAALLAIDVGDRILKKKKLNDIIDKLAKVIVEWNTTKVYSQNNANCQHFIDDVCSAINVSVSFKGSLKHYIDALRKQGKCDIKWKVPEEIRSKFKIKEEKISFKSHKELDTLMTLIGVEMEDEKYKDDLALLKSFDRAFWLRHFRNNIHADFTPLCKDSGDLDCYFGDPSNTSFAKGWW